MRPINVLCMVLWYMLALVVGNIIIVELSSKPWSFVWSVILGGVIGYRMAKRIFQCQD